MVYPVYFHVRANGDNPYLLYLQEVERSGRPKEAAKIRKYVAMLSERGSYLLVEMEWAAKVNDVWELRPKPHRVFYFWEEKEQRYVLLQGFRKKSQRTPPGQIAAAESLRIEYLNRGD